MEKGYSIQRLCLLFGRSKQAYYKHQKRDFFKEASKGLILQMVQRIREEQPRMGGRKLYYLIGRQLPEGRSLMGRDAFFRLLRENGYLLRQRRVRVRTTDSRFSSHRYPNLTVGFVPSAAGELYVADITYIRTCDGRFYYLFLVTDAYSRKILGWYLSKTLEANGCIKALKMALLAYPFKEGLIHHSDRGSQYNSKEYRKLLESHGIRISMTQSGDPLENALAERVNGILKIEWLNEAYLSSIYQARRKVAKVIYLYNHCRPHLSLQMLTPHQGEQMKLPVKRLWKNYYKKRETNNSSLGERPGGKGREHPSRRAEKGKVN